MTAERQDVWAADVPISMPTAHGQPISIPMGGFCWTPAGIRHDVSDAAIEEMFAMPVGREVTPHGG